MSELIHINQYTLSVYYTSAECYKYSIIGDDDTVYESNETFYTSKLAEQEGRKTIREYL